MSRQTFNELLTWAEGDAAAVASTAAETVAASAVTIPGNYMQGGRVLNYVARGRLSSVSAATIRFRLRMGGLGGTVLWDSGLITTNSPTAALWKVLVDIQTRVNGASGSLFAMGEAYVGSAAAATVASATGAPAVVLGGSAGDDTPAAATVDLTTAQDLVLTIQWGASSASNTATTHQQFVTSPN